MRRAKATLGEGKAGEENGLHLGVLKILYPGLDLLHLPHLGEDCDLPYFKFNLIQIKCRTETV